MNNRISSIDAFRGFAVLSMVIVNFAADVRWVPAIFKHAPDIGLTVADFIAPFFIFAIGLTYRAAFDRRRDAGGFLKAAGQFAIRYFAIAGIGAVFAAGEALTGEGPGNWGVLQAIGISGIVCLFFIRLKPAFRFAAGLVLLLVYQFLLGTFFLQAVLSSSHGGLVGSLSWAGMLLLSTAVADVFYGSKKKTLFLSLGILAAGIALSFLFPVSKNRVSSSYVLITTGAGALLFLLFDRIYRTKKAPFLEWWGANPLFLYILHQFLLAFFALPSWDGWYAGASAWLTVVQLAALVSVLSAVAYRLYSRGIYIKL